MPADSTGLRVLVVDDDADMRELLAFVLESAGAHVLPAASVAEALALADTAAPDLIISDIHMPDEEAYAFIRALRAAGNTVPAVALTAGRDGRARALASGFQRYLRKPIDFSVLLTVVAELTARR